MCHHTDPHVHCFNPPVLQRNVLRHGEEEADRQSTRKELRIARRLRRRRNRILARARKEQTLLPPGEKADKFREVYSGAHEVLAREENEPELDPTRLTSPTAADFEDWKERCDDINLVYDYTGKILDFFETEFRRNSINGETPGQGMPVRVQVQYRVDPAMKWSNAFWDLKEEEIRIGEGDSMRHSYARDLSVIAHEFTHGVIQYSGGLKNTKEAGAINESIADVFACMIIQYYGWRDGQFPATPTRQQAGEATWRVGEFLFKKTHPYYQEGMAVRSLKAPGTAYDHKILKKDDQPAHLDGYVQNKGPWHNCSIPAHAFYLLATALGDYSWEKAGQIWYNALLNNRDPEVDFKKWAKLTVREARKLFGKNDPAFDETKRAWEQVGVL